MESQLKFLVEVMKASGHLQNSVPTSVSEAVAILRSSGPRRGGVMAGMASESRGKPPKRSKGIVIPRSQPAPGASGKEDKSGDTETGEGQSERSSGAGQQPAESKDKSAGFSWANPE